MDGAGQQKLLLRVIHKRMVVSFSAVVSLLPIAAYYVDPGSILA
jgi:hypothetical protein